MRVPVPRSEKWVGKLILRHPEHFIILSFLSRDCEFPTANKKTGRKFMEKLDIGKNLISQTIWMPARYWKGPVLTSRPGFSLLTLFPFVS